MENGANRFKFKSSHRILLRSASQEGTDFPTELKFFISRHYHRHKADNSIVSVSIHSKKRLRFVDIR